MYLKPMLFQPKIIKNENKTTTTKKLKKKTMKFPRLIVSMYSNFNFNHNKIILVRNWYTIFIILRELFNYICWIALTYCLWILWWKFNQFTVIKTATPKQNKTNKLNSVFSHFYSTQHTHTHNTPWNINRKRCFDPFSRGVVTYALP